MNASRAYVYAVAKACDRGETTREDAAAPSSMHRKKATQCALDAIQLLGGNGYINDYPTGGCCATPSSMKSAPAPVKSGAC